MIHLMHLCNRENGHNVPAVLSRKLFALDVIIGREVRPTLGAGVHLPRHHVAM